MGAMGSGSSVADVPEAQGTWRDSRHLFQARVVITAMSLDSSMHCEMSRQVLSFHRLSDASARHEQLVL